MQKQTSRVSTLILVVLMVLLATNTTAAPLRQTADPPGQITYQGHLLDSSNEPVDDGDYSMQFSLYDAAESGSLLWGPVTHTVTTSAGYFSVLLGAGTPITASVLGTSTYLEIVVEGETLTPRQKFTSTPFALVADDVNEPTLGDLNCSTDQIAKWNETASAWECTDLPSPSLSCSVETNTCSGTTCSVTCSSGIVTGGGCETGSADYYATWSYSKPSGNGWACQIDSGAVGSQVYAMCCEIEEATGYGYYASITIDHTKVSADEIDFPVLVSGTYDGTDGEPDIRTTANDGHVENTASGGASGSYSVPADLVFGPNIDGSNPYDFEIEKYDPSTGEIVAWVEIPSLSSISDTEFYMVYGDSGVTTSQEDVSGTWEGNFVGVWHLSEASGTRYDSTANGNHLTDNNTVSQATGQIGKCASFNRSNSEFLSITDGAQTGLDIDTDVTMSVWYDRDSGGPSMLMSKSTASPTSDKNFQYYFNSLERPVHDFWDTSTTLHRTGSADSPSTMEHWISVLDVSEGDLWLYRNGTINTTDTADSGYTPQTGNASFLIGGRYDGGSESNFMDGLIDEARVATTLRDADYIATSYNTQNDPTSFYTMGAEQQP